MANGGGGFKEEHAILSPKESCSGHRYSSVTSVFCSYGRGTVEGISDYGAGVYVVSGNHHQVCKGFLWAGVGPI